MEERLNLETGTVLVSFSNGDPPVLLQSLKGGHWEATWATGNTQAQVTLTLTAQNREILSVD